MGTTLIGVFWAFEARRYRFADVWYVRVRKIEENFYGPILRRNPVSPESAWGDLVAEDLFQPRFKVSRLYALRERLKRNYWAIFSVLLGAWMVKVVAHPEPAESWAMVRGHLGGGLLPWWLPLVYVGLLIVCLAALLIVRVAEPEREHEHGVISP